MAVDAGILVGEAYIGVRLNEHALDVFVDGRALIFLCAPVL